MRNIVCIYHGNCADGFTAAWVLWDFFKKFEKERETMEFIPATYGDEPPYDRLKNSRVYILDFSYGREEMIKISKIAHITMIIDHHKTAQDVILPLISDDKYNIGGIFNMEKSGALLTWEWFSRQEEPPMLVKYVSDRDLWKFELPNSKAFSMFLFSYEYTFDDWDMIDRYWEDNFDGYILQGEAIQRKHMKDVKELCDATTKTQNFGKIGAYWYPVANLPYTMASDGCKYIAEKYTNEYQEQIGFTYYKNKDGKYVFSIRANDNTDVSEIAKIYGGGGHKAAAGFVVDVLPWE